MFNPDVSCFENYVYQDQMTWEAISSGITLFITQHCKYMLTARIQQANYKIGEDCST